jgi:hypothetical protein
VAINLRGTFLCLKHEIAAMLDSGGGAIVNMTSTAGLEAVGGLAAYVSTKHGIVGLTKGAALEYAARGPQHPGQCRRPGTYPHRAAPAGRRDGATGRARACTASAVLTRSPPPSVAVQRWRILSDRRRDPHRRPQARRNGPLRRNGPFRPAKARRLVTCAREKRSIPMYAIALSEFGGPEVLRVRDIPISEPGSGQIRVRSLAGLAILWPRRDWEFSLSPAQFIGIYIELADDEPLELPMIHRDLALHMGNSAELNRKQLRWLTGAFRATKPPAPTPPQPIRPSPMVGETRGGGSNTSTK